MKHAKNHESDAASLGDYVFPTIAFRNIDKAFTTFIQKEFKKKSARERFRCVNQALLLLIQEAPTESFLLPAVNHFIERINKEHILKDLYNFSVFEFWLNQFSEITEEDNYRIRGKIAGKFIPRDDYQNLFPIGMGKSFNGSHFVAAHLSPDVDTMVASFWGWLDAFAARVGTARHLWHLPGGPPDSPVVQTFEKILGPVFSCVASHSNSLTLTAIDVVTQRGFIKKKVSSTINALDNSIVGDKAIILIDENGYYQGEWHRSDADPIRQIVIRFKSCLRWFENNLHVRLISLFAKKKLHVNDIPDFLSSVFEVSINDSEPVKEFVEKQKSDLNEFFQKVLELPKGISSTYGELLHALTKLSVEGVQQFQKELIQLSQSELFDAAGYLKEDRPAIFNYLEMVINLLDNAIHYVRDYAERLDVAINIKNKVFETPPLFITLRSNIEDIRIKLQKQEYITVIIPEDGDKLFPLGVVWANSLQKPILGTVSFRDFCNQEEVKMASYLATISVVDHHKASLKTSSPPLAILGDTQSCNVLLAEQAFAMNEHYAFGGMTRDEIKEQLQQLQDDHHKLSSARLQQRLLRHRIALDHRGKYFVHPDRELAEYLCFLHAILDDTDLLTKVSKRDVECVVQLLNRIKSLTLKKTVEIINLDDLPRDQNFAQSAAKRILKHPEMYSFYRKVYESKEQEIERNLTSVLQEDYENLFVDTKEQNGCCRVGQTKLFSINIPAFEKTVPRLLEYWVHKAEEVYQNHPEIDLHLHMVSTISSADEVFQDKVGHYSHQDELWFWIPPTQKAYDHLSSFLTGFQNAQKFGSNISVEFLHPEEHLRQVFTSNWPELSIQEKNKKLPDLPIAILRFGAGLLNSRKAMITPYLPRII